MITPFWATIGLSLLVPGALSATSTTSTTSTSTASSSTCTASLITTLCDYPEPADGTAVASSGKSNCWDYCNDNPPCSFVIFVAGNPYLGTGTCWLYPGENFDESKGSTSGCSNPYLSVYDEPVCSSPTTATATASACAATRTPSAVAEVCGYPPPDEVCFYDCYASSGASNCLSICAEADSCSYAVFNPHNENNSQYEGGTCWVYPNGTYNADDTTICSGDAEQYVYKNACPKPSSSSLSSKERASGTGTSTGTATTETGSSAAIDAAASAAVATSSENSGAGLQIFNPAIAVAILLLQAL